MDLIHHQLVMIDEIVFVWDRNVRGSVQNPEWWANTFVPLKKQDEKWYVVHHSKGVQPKESDSIILKKGTNVPNDHVYGKVVSILFDSDGKKKGRIIEEVFTLETILVFLHACLEKKPEVADLKKFEEKTSISVLPEELKGELYSDEYFKSLSELRGRLLNGGGRESDNCG
jgi:hypothetical protein